MTRPPTKNPPERSRRPEDRYKVLGRFAMGTMAEVYLARATLHSGETKDVVLKHLLLNPDDEEEAIKMFYDEAMISSRLAHPNIVEIYELFEMGASSRKLCIAMDLVRGVNLQELHERMLVAGARMPVAIVAQVASGVLSALEYAHAFTDGEGRHLGIVHRDIAPQNILISWDGAVKLIDFGVAKAEGRLQQTRAGGLKGKLGYMSPEQIAGFNVDNRSDLFALGEVLFQALYDVHPFHAEIESEFMAAIAGGKPASIPPGDPHVPPEVASFLLRALELHPDRRYRDAREMRDGLFASTRPVTPDVLGRFVREVFVDRVSLEARGYLEKNDAFLVEALRVGARIPKETYLPPPEPSTDDGPPIENTDVLDLATVIDHSAAAAVRRESKPQMRSATVVGAGSQLGDYSIDRHLRAAKLGEVFLARRKGQLELEKPVELLVLDQRIVREARSVEIVLSAARKIARVVHPNVGQIFDIGADAANVYVASEWIDGWDLAQVLSKAKTVGAQLPIGLACRITADVCAALDAAHRAADESGNAAPAIHGALTPECVLVSRHGAVKVIDFGVVLARSSYQSDERSDVDAAAELLRELCTDPPRNLDIIVSHAVTRTSTDRYSIARALQMDLESFMSRVQESTSAYSLGAWMHHLFEGL